jgi:hypothetical protein
MPGKFFEMLVQESKSTCLSVYFEPHLEVPKKMTLDVANFPAA